jgi:hypothetical protein
MDEAIQEAQMEASRRKAEWILHTQVMASVLRSRHDEHDHQREQRDADRRAEAAEWRAY